MQHLKRHWWRIPAMIRKPLVFVVGFAVVIGGIILLPLPGPGWVVIFFGLAILATEFAFAERLRDKLIGLLKEGFARAKSRLKKPKPDR